MTTEINEKESKSYNESSNDKAYENFISEMTNEAIIMMKRLMDHYVKYHYTSS